MSKVIMKMFPSFRRITVWDFIQKWPIYST